MSSFLDDGSNGVEIIQILWKWMMTLVVSIEVLGMGLRLRGEYFQHDISAIGRHKHCSSHIVAYMFIPRHPPRKEFAEGHMIMNSIPRPVPD